MFFGWRRPSDADKDNKRQHGRACCLLQTDCARPDGLYLETRNVSGVSLSCDTNPAVFFSPNGKFDVRIRLAVHLNHFLGLTGQNAREHETAAGRHAAKQGRSEYLERVGKDVGNNQGIATGGQIPRQHKLGRHFVVFGVEGCAFDGLRINVGTGDVGCAELGGCDGENTCAAAVVKDRIGARDVSIEPLQTKMRRRMRARTEGHARIESDIDGFA